MMEQTNEEKRQEWRKARMIELENLPIDDDFVPQEGLYLPFGADVLIKEIKQGEIKSKSGLITTVASNKTIGASVGYIAAKGEDCFKPIFEGMKVYYEPTTALRVYIEGEEYVQISEHQVYGAVTPNSYLQPYVVDFIQRRREKRIESQQNIVKIEQEQIDVKNDKREQERSGKKNFAVTKKL